MKFDYSKNMSSGRRRNLKAFGETMLELLKQKSFDEITVAEICDLSIVPKSTFYNYFDDKHDLLNYCFYAVRQMITGVYGDWNMYDGEKALNIFSAFLKDYREEARQILRNNPDGSTFQWALLQFLIQAFQRIRIKFPETEASPFPEELQSKISAYILLSVCEWICRNDDFDEKETVRMMKAVFRTIQI